MTANGNGTPKPGVKLPNDQAVLPRRFYKTASAAKAGDQFTVELDGRPVRTPRKQPLAVPQRAFADVLAAEWDAQTDVIDPASMPLTRLANTAIDGVAGREAEVADDLVKYAGSDLLCYRADHPMTLVERQAAVWDPVLSWAAGTLGASLRVVEGVMPVDQEPAALASLKAAVTGEDAFCLTALHVMTTLTGSAILALAVRHGRVTAEDAWRAAHVDEDWQIEQWGEDAEATTRRAKRWQEMQAAARMLELLD